MAPMTLPAKNPIGLLLSGGLDSGILLTHLLAQGERVQPIYIDSQLVWQPEELAAVRKFLAAVASPDVGELKILNVPLGDVYAGHWSLNGRETPDADSPDEAVYLPGRNPLLLVKAAVWCRLNGIDRIALAPLLGNPFADATDEFFTLFEQAMSVALSGPVKIERPFGKLTKRQVMRLARNCPLEFTFSCIAPVDGLHCGRCNKCAERHAAFRDAEMEDSTRYAITSGVARTPTRAPTSGAAK